MTSGLSQGSVLGPLLFVTVYDLDENEQGRVSKFADYIKVGGVIDSEDGFQRLQHWIGYLSGLRNG